MHKYANSQLPAAFNNYFKLITDVHLYKSKLDNLFYQKYVLKC